MSVDRINKLYHRGFKLQELTRFEDDISSWENLLAYIAEF